MPTNPTLHLQESSQFSEHSHSNNPLAMPVNIRTVSIIIGSIILIIGLISVTLGCVPYVFLEIRHDPNVATAINIWAGAMYIICGSLAIVNHCQRVNHHLLYFVAMNYHNEIASVVLFAIFQYQSPPMPINDINQTISCFTFMITISYFSFSVISLVVSMIQAALSLTTIIQVYHVNGFYWYSILSLSVAVLCFSFSVSMMVILLRNIYCKLPIPMQDRGSNQARRRQLRFQPEAGRRPKVRFSEPETALSNQSSLPLK
ncbi:hypothetical protein TrispH2_008048 [Trichoplax sp. H2]|nr:hypothetical protein TrispH2_008048 [Trichoplax sp. H2]|eukprot:RDD40793.1 hypothetical protein TrispH2_008048 [Trichoplax sp. H2]